MNFISDFQFQISVRRRESECDGSGSGDDNRAKKFPAFFAAFFLEKKHFTIRQKLLLCMRARIEP